MMKLQDYDEPQRTQFMNMGFRPDFDFDDRIIKQEDVELNGETYFLSTVDLGLNHGFNSMRPLYYETMIFHNGNGGYMQRYETKEQAIKGHEKVKLLLLNNKIDFEE